MAENETDGLETFVQRLSSLRTKALYGLWALLTALWAAAVQWLLPKITALTPVNKFLLQLLGASWLLLVALGLSWLILNLRLRMEGKKKRCILAYGLKWDDEANPLCPKCENPAGPSNSAMVAWCPFCEVRMSVVENGEIFGYQDAVQAMKRRMAHEKEKKPAIVKN